MNGGRSADQQRLSTVFLILDQRLEFVDPVLVLHHYIYI